MSSFAVSRSLSRAGHLPPLRRLIERVRTQETKLLVGSSASAVILAYVLVRRSPTLAFALLLVVPALRLLTRSNVGVLTGLVLVLALPSWQTLGTAQVSVLRLASLAAASTLLFSRERSRLNTTDVTLLLLVAVTVGGWLLQYNQPHAGRVLSIELTPLGFYLGARALSPRSIEKVMVVSLFAGTVGALTVIFEYFVGHTVFLDTTAYHWSATTTTIFRPGGIFGGPPQASTVLCFVIIFGFAALFFLRGRIRLLGVLSLAICAVALALTFTRAAFIGLAAAILLYLLLTRSPLLRPTRIIWALGVALLLILFALPAAQKSTTLKEGVFRTGTLTARESYWSAAMPIVTSNSHNFIFGIGTAALETPGISQSAPVTRDLAVRPKAYTASLHSQYVTELVEGGVIGFLALALLLLVPFARVLRVARASGDRRHAALAASILAVAIVMSVDTVLLDGPSFTMIMVATAFAGTASAPGPGQARTAILTK